MDQARNTDLRPAELRTEIGQLEDEKKQLTEKISKLKSNVSEEPGLLVLIAWFVSRGSGRRRIRIVGGRDRKWCFFPKLP